MALKRKERALSPEEIKEKLLTTHAPFWLHSPPLCSLTATNDSPRFLPLSSSAEQNLFIIFLLDAGDYTTDQVMGVLNEWKTKYRDLPWAPVLAFEQKYLFLKNSKFFEHFKQNPAFMTTPLFLDPHGEWFQTFKTENEPHILFVNQGNVILKEKLWPNFSKRIEQVEKQFQEVLRISDPGLPLTEVSPYPLVATTDLNVLKAGNLIQGGSWTPANQSLMTEDSQASLSFTFDGKNLRLLSITHPQARENAKVQISLNDEPIPTQSQGNHLHSNEKGQSVLEINRTTGVYEIITSASALKGTLKLKFSNAAENPVIFYEMRSG